MAVNCDNRAYLLALVPPPAVLPPCNPPATPRQSCHYQHGPERRRRGGPQGWETCLNCAAASEARLGLTPNPGVGLGMPPIGWMSNLPAWPPAVVQTAVTPDALFPTPAELANGVVSAARPNPPWEGFLTRCCAACENLIEQEIFNRTTPVPTLAVPFPPAPWPHDPILDEPANKWHLYPSMSCTCAFRLGLQLGLTLCHHHQNAAKDQMIAEKKTNDMWLRNVHYNRKPHILRQASDAENRARVTNASWRACRVSTTWHGVGSFGC